MQKETEYQFWYREQYLPTKRHRNCRTHERQDHEVLRVEELTDNEFPVACVVRGDEGNNEFRYYDGCFFVKEDRADVGALFLGNARYPLFPAAGSHADMEQGWKETESVLQGNNRAEIVGNIQKEADKYVFFREAFWQRVSEPHLLVGKTYWGDMHAYLDYGLCDAGLRRGEELDERMYSLMDIPILRKKCEASGQNKYRQGRCCIPEVEIRMPEVFCYGKDAERMLHDPERGAYSKFKFSDQVWLESLRKKADEPSAVETYLKQHLADVVIQLMKEDEEPLYRVSRDYAMKALKYIMNEAIAAYEGSTKTS